MKRLDPNLSLIIGIGNQGRQDDGLGWACLDSLIDAGWSGDAEVRYQLNIEDAELISHYDSVLFIDADKRSLESGYLLEKVDPKPLLAHSSHFLPPSNVLYLCQDIYGKLPETHLLSIQGYEWELQIGLTNQAIKNYLNAKKYLLEHCFKSF
jgi:hydrogenase maturation protease